MQWFCWHVPAKMSLGFLCLFLVCNTGKDNGLVLPRELSSLFLHFTALCIRREHRKEKQVAVLATAELPAKSVDLAAINLTELVNSMLSTALRGTKNLFSLLSITSYSSFAFHKASVTIYNISNVKNVDPGKFPMHYCYCLNNVTNDLTDFTALLVDIIGNSTSYLTEIFKSTSILSARPSNDSDCIYICVMTGQTGRNMSDFWEMLEKSPVINYTFSSNTSSDLDSIFSSFMKLQEDPNKTVDLSAEHVWIFKNQEGRLEPLWLLGAARPHRQPCSPATVSTVRRTDTRFTLLAVGSTMGISLSHKSQPWGLKTTSSGLVCLLLEELVTYLPACDSNMVISKREEQSSAQGAVVPVEGSLATHGQSLLLVTQMEKIADNPTAATFTLHVWALPPHWVHVRGTPISCKMWCPQAILKESRVTSPPVTLIVQKINPCVMELCRFFQLCLCVGQRRYSRKEAMRYCVEYYSWFLKNASYVCERVKRVAYSHTLKQKCLKNICRSV
ncbi:HHLA1 protein, partial [Nyctibius grandis]|nr:HHLA1 protein [Nyctibius grandis]